MRTFSLLILALGAVASHPLFHSDKEYVFEYQGKILNGIPELNTQFAGLTIQAQVILQAKDPQTFKLALKQVKSVKFNEKLDEPRWATGTQNWQNWRKLRTPETQQIPSEFESILESPIEVSMVNGEVRNIQIAQNEPEWAVNFKKSLVSLLKVQVPTNKQNVAQNILRPIETSELPTTWRVMEQGIDGKCENTYQVMELPQYMLQEFAPELIEHEKCQGNKVLQVIKSRDVNKCVERASFQVNQPGKYLCPTGNCGSMWQRSSITKYIACGVESGSNNMEIVAIYNQGELHQSLQAYRTENVVTGVMQYLRIKEVRSSLSQLPQIQSPRTVEDLFYEYPIMGQQKPRSAHERQQLLQNLPLTAENVKNTIVSDSDSILSKIAPSALKQRIVSRIEKVVADLKEVERFEKKHVANQVLTVSKLFSLLSTEDMKSLYQQVKRQGSNEEEREIARQLIVEIAVMTGTNPSIMFVKHLIESEEMSPVRMGVSIAMLPHYIRTPTIKLLNEIFDLIKSPAVTKYEVLKTNSQLAFATLLHRACIAGNRATRFPVFVYGEFCTAETSELVSKFIPYFANELQSAQTEGEKISAVLTLGAIGHKSVLSVLLPYIEGKSRSTPVVQRMAIYSLNSVAHELRDELLPVYSALVHNPSEERNVRIAALAMMLKMEPSMVYFQKLATSTWFEEDKEFHKFVFSTLKTMSEIQVQNQPGYTTPLFQNSFKARMVLPLAKPIGGFFTSTLNYFTAEYLKDLEIGYHMHGAYSLTSNIKQVYGKLEYFMEQLKFTPIEFCFHTQGTSQLVEKISQIIGSQTIDSIHPEWRNIVSALNLQQEDREVSMNTGIWAKLFDDVQFTTGFGANDVEPMLRSVKNILSQPQSLKEKICGRYPLNAVKVNNWAPTEILIPSDMGLPIVMEFNMPSVWHLRGDIDVQCSGSIPSVNLNLVSKASAAMTGYVGTVCPFTKEIVAAGLNEETIVNYPVKVSGRVEMGKLKVSFSETNELKSTSSPVDVWALTIKPFTVMKPVAYIDAVPIVAHQNTKIIKSHRQLRNKEFEMYKTLGLDVKFQVESEQSLFDMKSVVDQLALYKYNPLNVALFSWTNTAVTTLGYPSLRYHAMRLEYNPQRSSTKEIEFEMSLALAQQKENQAPKALVLSSLQNQPLQIQDLQAANQQHQQLQQALQKLDLEQGLGFTTKVEINLKGGSPKTYNFVMTAGHGQRGMEQKWNLHLESEQAMSFCMDGGMTLPMLPLRDAQQLQSQGVRYAYKNTIGFGKTCQEHQIKIDGTTSVSQRQQQKVQQENIPEQIQQVESKIQQLQQQLQQAQQQLQQTQQQDQQQQQQQQLQQETLQAARLQEQIIAQVQKLNQLRKKQLEQLSTLDNVKFHIEYTPMPEFVKRYSRMFEAGIKTVLMPYITGYESQSRTHGKIDVELKFQPEYNTFNMELRTEEGTMRYNNIRIPERLQKYLPFVASEYKIEKLISQIQEDRLYPFCRIGDGVVKAFSNKTYTYHLDDCYHVISADSGRQMTHSVLAKEVNGKKHVKVYVLGSKVELKARQHGIEIEMDGQNIRINRNERREVVSQNRKVTYRIHRTADDVVVVETPYNRISTDGRVIEVENTKPVTQGELKGLCGSSNGDRRQNILTAQACIAQTCQAAALTYRIQDQTCTPLSQEKQIYKQQQIQCEKPQTVKVQVSQLLQKKSGECSQMKHSLIRQTGRLCISQIPIVQCGGGCAPKSLVKKAVPFTCIPADRKRVIQLYEEKVRRGDILPELRNMDKSFTSEMNVPVSCSHPGLLL